MQFAQLTPLALFSIDLLMSVVFVLLGYYHPSWRGDHPRAFDLLFFSIGLVTLIVNVSYFTS